MPNREDFHTMPGHLIRRAHQISVAIFMEECAAHNVTPVQYACLSQIARQPGVDATRLASAVAFDRSTLGNVLERLEAKGWVDRRPSAEDRRVKLLYITASGEQLLEAIEPAVLATQKRLLKPLSVADRKLFLRLVSEMVEGNNDVSRAPPRACGRGVKDEPMAMLANCLVALVAMEHVLFLVIEMFLWRKPLGMKTFGTTPEFAEASAALAANQGLYNGFLAAGLAWSLAPTPHAFALGIFFLGCVIVAGLFGAATVKPKIALIQALPAALALAATLASY